MLNWPRASSTNAKQKIPQNLSDILIYSGTVCIYIYTHIYIYIQCTPYIYIYFIYIYIYSSTVHIYINVHGPQAFSVALLRLPLNTFFEDAFPGRQFGKVGLWRHILTPHCLTPHFGLPPHLCLTPHFDAALFDATFRIATTFVRDGTFRRHSVWHHISIISEAPPH